MTTGIIKFTRKSVDTTNSYSPTSGRFSVPFSGRYTFRIHLRTDAATAADLNHAIEFEICLDVDGQCGPGKFETDVLTRHREHSQVFAQDRYVNQGNIVGWKYMSGKLVRMFDSSFFEAILNRED
jgi:hypothetical protein